MKLFEPEIKTKFTRCWSMPNRETFALPPVADLLRRHIRPSMSVVDPFARDATWGTVTNDLDPDTDAKYHHDAYDFLAMMTAEHRTFDAVLLDPPYSPRQMAECYRSVGLNKGCATSQNATLYSRCKDSMSSLLVRDGIAITCGWNSNGFGINRGFELLEVLLVPHGGAHNDTIVTVERKAAGD